MAIKLNSTYIPDWIHEENNTYVSDSIGVEDKYLAVYGFCPMRPIWEYLRNTIRGCTFFEIDPTPSICNLAVALRESKSSIEKILKNVSMFDSDITFNKDILLGDYKYLLVSAMNEDEIWVNTYENIKFYTSSQLSIENATIEFLEKVESRPICTTDIYNEIEFLCKNISKKMKIIFLNNSEVEFATKGKDLNYNFRLKTNEILEELSSIHKNLILIDFNKFAANEFDFFDEKINHYNREIGYKIAQEIAKIIGMNESKKISENKSVINKKICFNNESEILFKSILENGNLQININLSNFTKNRLALVVLRNRNIYWESDILEKIDKNLAISTIGIYDFVVKIFDLAKKEIFSIKIDGYPFTQYNYIDFINPNKQNYNEYRILLESFIKRNLKDYLNLNSFSLILNNLHSVGINLADFFLFKSISNIDLVITHKEYLFQILPLLHNSKIVINNIYTTEEISKINVYDIKQKRFIIYKIKPLKDGIVKSFSKVILFDNKPIHHAYNILIKGGSQIYFLSSVLSYLTTKKIFLDDIIANMYTHGIKTYAIRLPRPERRSFDMTSIKNEERAIVRLLKNKDFTKEIYEKFPPSYRNKVFTELKTEIDSIRYSKIEGNHYVLCDVSNEYVNIKNGFRNVKYSQKDCKNNLFLIGGKNSIGYGVSDSETIGSYLQKFIGNKYCVKSYSNFEGNKQKDYENIFYAFQEKKIILNKGDIVVFILDNSINEGFRKIYENSIDWNAIIDNPHIKTIDGYSLFLNGNRQNYFFSNFGYTKECNYDIAKLIKNNL